jgi:hypothetical protein
MGLATYLRCVESVCVRACVCVHVSANMHAIACVCVCVRACVRVCGYVCLAGIHCLFTDVHVRVWMREGGEIWGGGRGRTLNFVLEHHQNHACVVLSAQEKPFQWMLHFLMHPSTSTGEEHFFGNLLLSQRLTSSKWQGILRMPDRKTM